MYVHMCAAGCPALSLSSFETGFNLELKFQLSWCSVSILLFLFPAVEPYLTFCMDTSIITQVLMLEHQVLFAEISPN